MRDEAAIHRSAGGHRHGSISGREFRSYGEFGDNEVIGWFRTSSTFY